MAQKTTAHGLLTFAATCVAAPALGQADVQEIERAANARATARLEEVVVTAQRRESSLQELPISVRALTGVQLQRLGAAGIEQYAGSVPGLNLIHGGTPGRTQIDMRGVTIGQLREDRPEFGPTVGIYLDEAPIAAQTVNASIALADLERVEVLRGPQATLYGAGSLSGTIRMITRKPDLEKSGGRFGVGGSYTENGEENFDYNGVVNVPVIKDELALRAVGFYRDQAGYVDNTVLGTENVNSNRDVGGRLALRYEPTDVIRLNASFGYQESEIDARSVYFVEAGDLNTQDATRTPQDSELTIASLVADIDFGLGTLTSATSYFGNNTKFDQELSRFVRFLTGTPLTDPPSSNDFIAAYNTFLDISEITQELRFVSKDEARLTWVAGMLLQKKDHSFGQDFPVPGIDAFTGIPSTLFLAEPDNLFKSRVDLETTQLSLFGEASVKLTDRLTAKAGLRWFDISQDSTTFFGGIFSVPNVGTASAEHDENGINPTFNVSYQIDADRMIYLQAARGFRLGGTNQPIPEDLCAPFLAAAGFTVSPASFDSDTLWNYEAGLKSSWLDDRLRLNASGYVIDWQDPPYAVAFGCGFSSIINAGDFDISGFELDIEAALREGLITRLGISYTDSKLGEDVQFANGVKGDKAPFTPEVTASFSLDYDFPVAFLEGGLMAFVHGDVRWVDERMTKFPLQPDVFTLSPYSEGNLRAGLYSDVWRFDVFISNLWDERPELNKLMEVGVEFAGAIAQTLRPRTFGVQLSREF